MGLAGRDSVCFALLDTESTLHGRLVCKPNGVALIQDLRLRCHGVMGQGQFDIDNQGPDQLFTRSLLLSTRSEYGALARDGVSCAVRHPHGGRQVVRSLDLHGLVPHWACHGAVRSLQRFNCTADAEWDRHTSLTICTAIRAGERSRYRAARSVRVAAQCRQLPRNSQLEIAHRQLGRREYQVAKTPVFQYKSAAAALDPGARCFS